MSNSYFAWLGTSIVHAILAAWLRLDDSEEKIEDPLFNLENFGVLVFLYRFFFSVLLSSIGTSNCLLKRRECRNRKSHIPALFLCMMRPRRKFHLL